MWNRPDSGRCCVAPAACKPRVQLAKVILLTEQAYIQGLPAALSTISLILL
jgi:hypothetical protein